MRTVLALALSRSITAYAQQPPRQSPAPPPAPSYAPQDAPPHTESATPSASLVTGDITVPAGTKIQLYLTNPLLSRPANRRRRACQSGLPVVIANQLAIPRGTYVDGALTRVTRPGFSRRAKIQIQFTRLIFENGYQLPLTSATAEASNQTYGDAVREVVADAWNGSYTPTTTSAARTLLRLSQCSNCSPFNPRSISRRQRRPPQQPLPGQSRAEAIGIAAGVAVAAIAIIGVAHRGRDIYVDSGWRFEMILQSPISRNAAEGNGPIPAP